VDLDFKRQLTDIEKQDLDLQKERLHIAERHKSMAAKHDIKKLDVDVGGVVQLSSLSGTPAEMTAQLKTDAALLKDDPEIRLIVCQKITDELNAIPPSGEQYTEIAGNFSACCFDYPYVVIFMLKIESGDVSSNRHARYNAVVAVWRSWAAKCPCTDISSKNATITALQRATALHLGFEHATRLMTRLSQYFL